MYYRLAIQQGRDRLDWEVSWQWKSTALSSLQSLFQVLRLYSALPQEHLRVFSSSSREGLEEQLSQENSGRGSSSVTVARFLQQHMIHSRGVTSAGGVAHAPCERDRSSLEWRRLEHERGAGVDHDLPYHFALPLSLPQVLAWTRLLGRVQCGEIEL